MPESKTTQNENKPNPGSLKAREQGCKCPVVDNCYGQGIGGDGEQFGFVVAGICTIHGGELNREG